MPIVRAFLAIDVIREGGSDDEGLIGLKVSLSQGVGLAMGLDARARGCADCARPVLGP